MYAQPRSANKELRLGIHEGSLCAPGKDWGGPQDEHTRYPDSDNDHECLVDPLR